MGTNKSNFEGKVTNLSSFHLSPLVWPHPLGSGSLKKNYKTTQNSHSHLFSSKWTYTSIQYNEKRQSRQIQKRNRRRAKSFYLESNTSFNRTLFWKAFFLAAWWRHVHLYVQSGRSRFAWIVIFQEINSGRSTLSKVE